MDMFETFGGPQWYVHTVDCALLHVAALIYDDVKSERLFAFAGLWSFNRMMDIWRKLYPQRKFPDNIEGLGDDKYPSSCRSSIHSSLQSRINKITFVNISL